MSLTNSREGGMTSPDTCISIREVSAYVKIKMYLIETIHCCKTFDIVEKAKWKNLSHGVSSILEN
jgi:hypothetical protein